MAVNRAAVVRKADEFVSQGKLDLAIAEYRALLDEQPADLGAANTLGDLYARTGEIAKAIDQFTRLAESERAQGFTSKAIALYKKALKVDPGCDEALSQLAEIAVGQELLADATLYWNRLVQHRRERSDAPGVAQALIRLAGLSVAKADTKLAAARAAEPHVAAGETARLYAAAAEALARESRGADAVEAWLEAAARTDDVTVRRAAACACVEAGQSDRAEPFLTVDVAGDEPALLWAVGERAAHAGDETVATRALGRYRTLVPDDAERASALLSAWEAPEPAAPEPAPEVVLESTWELAPESIPESAPESAAPAAPEAAWQPIDSEEVDLLALLDAPAEAPAAVPDEVALDETADETVEAPVVERFAGEDAVFNEPAPVPAHQVAWEDIDVAETIDVLELPQDDTVPIGLEPPAPPAAARSEDDSDAEIDEAATIAQLQAAADTPALRFQAAAQLGRWFLQKGQTDRGVEWLERACAVPAPVREHGLAARYDLADALERTGQQDRALACWSDLEFDAGSYRDVAERLARLTRELGSSH